MAIYEYRCPACNHRFECLVLKEKDGMTACPACGRKGLLRSPSPYEAEGRTGTLEGGGPHRLGRPMDPPPREG